MATLALFALISQAELLFYNPGTQPANWDYVRREHQGTVDQINNVVYKGDTALKMTQTYDSNYDGRYHSEVDHNDGYRPGDTRYYGFMFRLSEAWEFSPQGYNIAQFIADRNGAGCDEDDWMPSSMVWIKGDQLTSRIVSGNYRQPDCSREFDQLDDLATVSAGVWHKVIIKATWETDSTGQYTMWFDDEQVIDRQGVATTVTGDEVFQFRVGLYANTWKDDPDGNESNQDFRQVWYDEIAVGTTYEDVDPDQP